MRLRTGIALLALLALLLLGGWTAYWYVAAKRVEAGMVAWDAARRAEGWAVAAGSPSLGGWPVAARVTVPRVRLVGGALALPVGLVWAAPLVAVQVRLLHPGMLEVIPLGAQRIGLQGGPAATFAARAMRARVPLDAAGPPWPIDFSAEALRVGSRTDAPAGHAGEATIGELELHAETDPTAPRSGAAVALSLAASTIVLPPERSWPLGARIETVAIDGTVSGPAPAIADPMARARAWRDAGGTALLRHGLLRWGPLAAEGQASMSLDAALQPVAHGEARVQDYAQALDVMAAHRAISDHAALAAKAVLSLLAEAPPGGGAPELDLPFTLQDRVLSIKHIPLIKLPKVAWPGT